jgi:hypothetical protein
MKMPGFTAEASVYRATGRYYMGGAPIQSDGSIYLALQSFCPPKCISACEQGCRADGLSSGFCARLCNFDCSAYSSIPISCGPCVNGVRTCILCGIGPVTETCVTCEVCPDGSCKEQCPGGTCPCGASCCPDGDGCCRSGWYCVSCPWWLGGNFCSPIPVPWCESDTASAKLQTPPSSPGLTSSNRLRFGATSRLAIR